MKSVAATVVLGALVATPVAAQTATQDIAGDETRDAPQTDTIVVYGRAIQQIGRALSGSQGTVGYRDFEDKPVSRVGELVENVPGVIATQHSGTGKANQYFLRGFNLDHGTDFAGFVDGVPINMRSHGHGQGYLDLNFLIPELVERIDYRKGPYFADVGDFAAAGTVQFRTVDRLPRPIAEVTVGSFGYYRALAAGSTKIGSGDVLLALDGTVSNGPWVLDENLRKINAALKVSTGDRQQGTSIGVAAYHATWTSTDQVPERAIESGQIGRFGFIDDDLGGRTTRLGATLNHRAPGLTATAFATYYDFKLTSNFTYFLADPVNGDEFQQRDRRGIFGGSIARTLPIRSGARPINLSVGTDVRLDRVGNIGLYQSVEGQRFATFREDEISEFSLGLFANAEVQLSRALRANVGLRADHYRFDVDAGLPINSGKGDDTIVTPKLGLAFRVSPSVELYANYGEGFHSNDVRGAAIRVDPATGDPAQRNPVLVRARGVEAGGRFETDRLTASAVIFGVDLDSELVFVGDGGSTEPNAASRRYGAETTLFWRPTPTLTFDASAAVTHARFDLPSEEGNRIPNAVGHVVALGAEAQLGHGFSTSLRLRHFGKAPLIEDNSQSSDPTTLLNLGLYYRSGRSVFGADVFNLFNSQDNDITYFYGSRLTGEPPEGVEDRHLHPVEPRQVRASVRFSL